MKRAVASPLVLAVAALIVLSAVGCEKTYTIPSRNLRASVANRPDGGLDLEVTFTVKNEGAKPMTFKFPTSKQFDMWILADGKEIARLSEGKTYAQAATTFTVPPGESKVFTDNMSIDPKWRQAGVKFELYAELVGQPNTELVLKVQPPGSDAVVPEPAK